MRTVIGSPVEGDDFFDREGERRRIWRHLESDSLLLLAPRRIGKTSLMRALCAEGPEHGFRSVSLSFACLFRRKWTAIPAQTGHLIRRKLDGCSR